MMKLMALVAALLVSACATPYKANGLMGGFSETQLDENVFRVSFRGNGYTGRDRVADFTLLRSAELALANGFKYFVVVDASTSQKVSSYTTPTTSNTTATAYGTSNYATVNATTTTYGGQTYNIVKPAASNTIVCFKEKPANVFSYNAEFVYDNIAQKYDVKPKAE